MSKEITVTIDGKECKAKEGEYILNVARENDIFIPAICYLTRCSPTLACRICLVEADGKQVYACNAKSKDGMNITTTTENIQKERKAIMEVYDVNHPLQCGVCDQSGECELQNYNLYEDINEQNYAIKDVDRPTQDWGHIQYDPGLCIVCERCVTVCKDMVGDTALKTVPRGGDKLDPEYKETMPKDSYAMWNKLNKSIIGVTTGDTLDCSSCGECTAVCPVGALVGTDFKYTSNAWELQKIPSTCAHCSAGCQVNYEVKHTDIENSDKKIYRVTNEFHYTTLCGAGRYGYDFENRVDGKDEVAFGKAVEALKSANYITFDSQITNEEALILQRLKEKLGLKLINEDARNYGNFLKAYSSVAGKSLYSGDLKEVSSSNFVISVGTALKHDNPNSRYAFNNALKVNKGAGVYFHPIEDTIIDGLSKNLTYVKYQPLEEAMVLYYILGQFGKELPENLSNFIESLKLNEIMPVVDFEKLLKKKDKFALLVGEDFYGHPDALELAQVVGLIDKYTDFSVTIIPPKANTLGVSQICELDESATGKGVGYNVKSDFTISALGDGDLDVPALNQQEGTFVNIDKRVVPLNSALPFNGYTLNDIANEILETSVENTVDYTVDYTAELFNKVAFDDLPNHFGNDQVEYRGYVLQADEVESRNVCPELQNKVLKGELLYRANPVLQFNEFTNKAHQLKEKGGVYLTPTLAEMKKVGEGDRVKISAGNDSLTVSVRIDDKLAGNVAYLPTFDSSIDSSKIFDGYRFREVKIEKV